MEVLELFLRKFAVIHHIVAIHIQTWLHNSCDSKWINISTCNRKSLARTAEPPRVLALVRVDSPSLYCSSWHSSLMVLPSTRMVPSDIHISWTWRQVDTVNENARKTWWSDCLKNWNWRLEQTLTLTSCFFSLCHVTLTTDVACWAWFVLHSRQIGVKQNKRKMKQTWKLTNCLTKNPNLRWWWWWWWQCRFRRSHREIPPLHLPNMGFFLNMFWYWHKTCTCCFGFLSTLIYVGVYWY